MANMLKMKHETFEFEEPWSLALSKNPSSSGIWLIYGKEKNGKTTLALLLARYLSTKKKTMYISGEEGCDKEFIDVCRRVGYGPKDSLLVYEYLPLDELKMILHRRGSADVIFLDNITAYRDELRNNAIMELKSEFPKKLFVFLAHEDRNEPSPAQARNCRKFAKVIIRVVGLKAMVSGRYEGGEYVINEEKAALYWGGSKQDQYNE